jgi:hypothetical protein
MWRAGQRVKMGKRGRRPLCRAARCIADGARTGQGEPGHRLVRGLVPDCVWGMVQTWVTNSLAWIASLHNCTYPNRNAMHALRALRALRALHALRALRALRALHALRATTAGEPPSYDPCYAASSRLEPCRAWSCAAWQAWRALSNGLCQAMTIKDFRGGRDPGLMKTASFGRRCFPPFLFRRQPRLW